jgi:hypothetical protein
MAGAALGQAEMACQPGGIGSKVLPESGQGLCPPGGSQQPVGRKGQRRQRRPAVRCSAIGGNRAAAQRQHGRRPSCGFYGIKRRIARGDRKLKGHDLSCGFWSQRQ